MNKMMMSVCLFALTGVITGCVSSEDSRSAYQKEYARLSSLPPAEQVFSPNKEIASCAKLSCDLFNEVHPLVMAYVDKVDADRKYTGFMNDIRYYVEEEKLSNADAMKKVTDAVIAADVNLPDEEKIWPKIQKGIAAANELNPKTQLIKLANLTLQNQNAADRVSKLPKSYEKEPFMDKINRSKECTAISKQLTEIGKCLVFLVDQYTRVVELENSSR